MSQACGARCESSEWLLGVAGVCNVTSGKCLCPLGYDGKDDFEDFNDCHINAAVRFAFHSMVFTLSLLVVLLSGLGLVYTSRRGGGVFVLWSEVCEFVRGVLHFGRYHSSSQQPPLVLGRATVGSAASRGSSLFESGGVCVEEECVESNGARRRSQCGVSTSPSSYSCSEKSARHGRFVSLRQFGMLFLFFCFGLSTSVFQGYMLASPPVHLFDGVVVQRLAYYFAASSMIVSLWQVTHMLYASLPNMGFFGPMFGISNVFTRYPSLVRVFTAVMGVLTSLSLLVTIVVLPLSDPANSYVVASTLVMAVDSCVWFLSMICVYLVLDKVYVVSIDAVRATSAVEGSVRSVFAREAECSFIRARTTIRYTIILVVLMGSLALACLVSILIVPSLSANMFMPFSIIGAIACLGCLALTYLMVFRSALLNKSKRPDEHEHDHEHGHAQGQGLELEQQQDESTAPPHHFQSQQLSHSKQGHFQQQQRSEQQRQEKRESRTMDSHGQHVHQVAELDMELAQGERSQGEHGQDENVKRDPGQHPHVQDQHGQYEHAGAKPHPHTAQHTTPQQGAASSPGTAQHSKQLAMT
jgi:hypothetical protein